MNEVKVRLTPNVARAVLIDIADDHVGYNKTWSWWAHEARENVSYPFGYGVARIAQRVMGDFNNTGEIEMVFELLWDDDDTSHFYRINGDYSSYGGDEWEEHTFKEVRPTERVLRVYE